MTIVPPLRAILDTPGTRIDAFIAPGHVSTVIGTDPYRFIPAKYGKQVVVAAFEPLDILEATAMILRQRADGRCELENQYTRVVRPEGNPRALEAIARDHGAARDVRVARPGRRSLRAHCSYAPPSPPGMPRQGSDCRASKSPIRKACQCGEVLVGAIKPWECKVFGTACTPEQPLGTCMVSSEGACAAYYSFGRKLRDDSRVGVPHERYIVVPRGDKLITLAHGSGGKATRRLVEGLFLEELSSPLLAELGDAAIGEAGGDDSRSRSIPSSSSRSSSPEATSASSP